MLDRIGLAHRKQGRNACRTDVEFYLYTDTRTVLVILSIDIARTLHWSVHEARI